MKNEYIDNGDGSSQLIINSRKFGKLSYAVDTEDVRRLITFQWGAKREGKKFYAQAMIGQRPDFYSTIIIHRFIMSFRSELYDHINRNPMDNRKINLRGTTPSVNARNSDKPENTSTIYRGVYKRNDTPAGADKFRVQIRYSGKIYNHGTFNCAKEAALKYNEVALKAYGKEATLNVISD